MLLLFTFGVVSARFIPYAEVNLFPEENFKVSIRIDQMGYGVSGKADVESPDGNAYLDFKIEKDQDGYIGLNSEDEFTLNCTWTKLDSSLINFFYQKGQEAMFNQQPEFNNPTELATYFETDKDGVKNDKINCMSSLKEESTVQVPLVRAVEPTKMKTDHHQIVTDMFSKQIQSIQDEIQAEFGSLFG